MVDVSWGDYLENKYPWVYQKMDGPCGCSDQYNFSLEKPAVTHIIAHIFDEHIFGAKDWTLERLVDWVRSVEPEEKTEATVLTDEEIYAEVS